MLVDSRRDTDQIQRLQYFPFSMDLLVVTDRQCLQSVARSEVWQKLRLSSVCLRPQLVAGGRTCLP